MSWFRVGGDYGPIGGMYHELMIYTSNKKRAIELFAKRIERDYPSDWSRMGYSNISCWSM